MAGLQVRQALWCPSYLGLGSAVPASMFLGTQLPYVTKALNFVVVVLQLLTISEREQSLHYPKIIFSFREN